MKDLIFLWYTFILVDSMLTTIGCVGTSTLIPRINFSFQSDSDRDEKSAAMLTLPRMCAMVKLTCWTKSHAFDDGGGIIYV